MTITTTSRLDSLFSRWGPVIYASLLLLTAFASHFGVLSNDCFPLRWQAERLSFSDPQSFYNGFFPIGYPILIRAVLSVVANPYPLLIALQACLAYFFYRWTYATGNRYFGNITATLAALIAGFYPFLLRAALSPVPDFLLVLSALYAFVIISSDERYTAAGVALGIGYLFRTHAIILVFSLSLSCILFHAKSNRWKAAAQLWLGVIPFILFQGLIQVWSGHGFFENSQAYNIWRTIHGSDWANPPLPFTLSALDVIRTDSSGFFQSYIDVLFSQLGFIVVLVGLLIYRSWRPRVPQSLGILAFASLVYVLLSSVGGSVRGALPIVPIVVIALCYLLRELAVEGVRNRYLRAAFRSWVPAVLCVIAFIGLMFSASKTRARLEAYQQIADRLHVTSKLQLRRVFTDDFDLYFPSIGGEVPGKSGGWPEMGLPEYLATHPRLPDATSTAFYSSAKLANFETIVLRNPPYDGRLSNAVRMDTLHFPPMGTTARHSLFSVR